MAQAGVSEGPSGMAEFELPRRDVYNVTRLNREVRAVLEGSFPLLWVEGEISNLARPSSGHIYFTLKDPSSQVRCAMFRGNRLRLRFQPANGQQVLLRARVSLYEGRGEFQLVAEHMEPSGEGALRLAFEQLKQRLAAEGLFDSALKRPLPRFPGQIGVITSPSGAAVRDVISVLGRRFPGIPLLIYPVQVQGESAPSQIVGALQLAAERADCEVLILCRGGGSLEDLIAFNDEAVARAIRACPIPVVVGVGHEMDYTIADFAADQRAPTPSAAAELASPDRADWLLRFARTGARLLQAQQGLLQARTQHWTHLTQRLQRLHPGQRLRQQQQRLDELERRLRQSVSRGRERSGERLARLRTRLFGQTPIHRLGRLGLHRQNLGQRLHRAMQQGLQARTQRLGHAAQTLDAVSPLATLNRGYSISRLPSGEVLRDSAQTKPGEQVETQLARGSILCKVMVSRPD
jgi:exodeoxyribonuclease VII large subunit